ncbi:VanZ family protein [Arabiibacter massiliensis]|uniref:VanZ family protein n=1 Tax=Arabiibacter massiliensis TaxID=1870985 RepID=UPI0009BBCF8C|nr:VanZ family protein [Arabiibacter massiliensis]
MGFISQFLGRFSESFMAAVALWPLASMALTLPILAYLYHRDGRLRAASAVTAYLAVLYVLGLGCFTLYPLPDGTSGPGITYGIPPRFNPLGFLDDFAKDGVRALPDMVANVAFFVPLGFIAGRFLRWGTMPTIALGFATSLLIETAQLTGLFGLYPHAYRMFDVLDLFCNTAGAAVGWGFAALAARFLPPGELAREGQVTDRPGFVRRAVAFWIDLTAAGAAAFVALAAASVVLHLTGDASWTEDSWWEGSVLVGVFVVAEGVVPWCRQGRTLGGGFVRMTCETRPRTGWRRLAFYAVRIAVLACAVVFSPLMAPALLLFYAVKRRMPYDFV